MLTDTPSTGSPPEPQPPRRRRGAQPGNLNAFQHGAYSRYLRGAYRFAPPGPLRDTVRAAVFNAVRFELLRLPDHPTSEERTEAVKRALRRVHAAARSRNYREAGSPAEVYRMWQDALDPVIRGDYGSVQGPEDGARVNTRGTNRTNGTNR